MNGARRWKAFMRYWNTVMADNYDDAADLVEEIYYKIEEIKRKDKKDKH